MYYTMWAGIYQIPIFLWVFWWPAPPRANEWNDMWWCALPALVLSANNVSIFAGVTIKSPFYVSLGTLLGIPLSFVMDVFIHGYKIKFLPVLGAVLLIISFLMLEAIPAPKQFEFLSIALLNKEATTDTCHLLREEESEKLIDPLVTDEQNPTRIKSIND